MERLPPELLAQVCSLSKIRSLKKIRLVNITFAQITAQYVFEGLCIILIPRYLDNSTEVAYVSMSVHCTSVATSSMRNLRNTRYRKRKIDTGEPGTSIGEEKGAEVYTQADLDHSHTNFCSLLASQKALFDGRMDLAMLSAAFAMLLNLRTIESTERSYLDPARATPYDSITCREKN